VVGLLRDESVDLIYLDPPFNSKASYNVLKAPTGEHSQAQIEAFEDTVRLAMPEIGLFDAIYSVST
jgi:16S rRNA G966 N2-methylase RsmD